MHRSGATSKTDRELRGLFAMPGGTVEAHGEGPGTGNLFVVRLPLSDHAPALAEDPEPGAALIKRRVLVVDDNKDSAVSMTMVLDLLGHETCTVYDGIAALEAARTFRPDLVLLDIGLPRLNGYDVARRIRAQGDGESMLLIAMTGWGQAEDKRRSAAAGFDLHLVKPVDLVVLERVLAGHIDEGDGD